ncbi:hypothetical protein Trydic_g18782 [Trypoxylus dichotomus]
MKWLPSSSGEVKGFIIEDEARIKSTEGLKKPDLDLVGRGRLGYNRLVGPLGGPQITFNGVSKQDPPQFPDLWMPLEGGTMGETK